MNIIFGVVVALAVFFLLTTAAIFVSRKSNPMYFAIGAAICTGIAAGMVYQ